MKIGKNALKEKNIQGGDRGADRCAFSHSRI
jgi:hypothetical protein